MPRIPQYTQQQSLPTSGSGVRVEPSEMLAEQAGMKRAGAALTDLGETLAIRGHQIQEDINKKRIVRTHQKYEMWALNDIIKRRERVGEDVLKADENGGYQFVSDTEKAHNESIEQFASTLDNDDQKEAFRVMATQKSESYIREAASHVLSEKHKYTTDLVNSAMTLATEKVKYSGGDPLKIAAARGELEETLFALGGEGYKKNFLAKFDLEMAKQQKEWEINGAIVDLKTRHGSNTLAALNEASAPEFLQKHGLEAQRHVRASLSEDMRINRLQVDALQGKLLAEYGERKAKGQSRADWHRNVQNLAREGKVSDEFMRGAIVMQNQEIEEARTGGITDPVEYNRLHERTMRGDIAIGEIMGSKRINYAAKNTLIDKFYSKIGADEREAEKQAKDLLKSQLVSTGPLGNPLPAEHDRLNRAYEAIDVHSAAARKAGKPWTVKEYNDYARQLSEFYRPTIESKVRDMNTAFGAPAAPATTKAAPADMKRKPGESIDAYLKRTGQE